METKKSALVIADISGYTRFIVSRKISQLHAELIITDLIEAVAASSRFPLKLHKLEGDAAFFIAPLQGATAEAFDSVIDQINGFFAAFRKTQMEHFLGCFGGCRCAACRNIQSLRLKVIAHVGDVLYKSVGGFEEVAGEDVILAHRLLKNSVAADEYLLLTQQAADRLRPIPFTVTERRVEQVEELGSVKVVVCQPEGAQALIRPRNEPLLTLSGAKDFIIATWQAMANRVAGQLRDFNNIRA